MSKVLPIFPAVFFLLYANPSSAEIYQWTDANGVTHFADRQPRGAAADRWALREIPDVIGVRRQAGARQPGTRQPAATLHYKTTSKESERSRLDRLQARADRKREREQTCSDLLGDLEQVQSQLRAGYREPRGNRLRERKRDLRLRHARECRW